MLTLVSPQKTDEDRAGQINKDVYREAGRFSWKSLYFKYHAANFASTSTREWLGNVILSLSGYHNNFDTRNPTQPGCG